MADSVQGRRTKKQAKQILRQANEKTKKIREEVAGQSFKENAEDLAVINFGKLTDEQRKNFSKRAKAIIDARIKAQANRAGQGSRKSAQTR